MERPVLIGIAGGTASGKTSVARHLQDSVGTEQSALIEQDSYYRPLGHLPLEERATKNFDHPDAIDWEFLREQIETLRGGTPIERPIYNYHTHDREERTIRQDPRPVIIIEGILVLWHPWVRDELDVKVFIDTPADLRLARRIRRDTLDRGRSLQAVLEQYEQRVRPMHEEFTEPSKAHADVIIPRGSSNEVALAMVRGLVRMRLSPLDGVTEE